MDIYLFMKATIGIFSKFFWIGKVEGKHNVPRKGGVILAPNHQSWFDFCFIAAVLQRRLYFLVGEFVYKRKFVAWALNRMKHIKVDRDLKDKSYVYKEAKSYLDQGRAVVVFPEGRMTRDGKIQQAYKGVAKMALASKVDIVPVVVQTYHIYSIHHKRPTFHFKNKATIKFLEPLRYEDFKDKDASHIVHDLLMPKIALELNQNYLKGNTL